MTRHIADDGIAEEEYNFNSEIILQSQVKLVYSFAWKQILTGKGSVVIVSLCVCILTSLTLYCVI